MIKDRELVSLGYIEGWVNGEFKKIEVKGDKAHYPNLTNDNTMSRLENKELRELRIKAHAHIDMLNEEQCKKVLELKLSMEAIH